MNFDSSNNAKEISLLTHQNSRKFFFLITAIDEHQQWIAHETTCIHCNSLSKIYCAFLRACWQCVETRSFEIFIEKFSLPWEQISFSWWHNLWKHMSAFIYPEILTSIFIISCDLEIFLRWNTIRLIEEYRVKSTINPRSIITYRMNLIPRRRVVGDRFVSPNLWLFKWYSIQQRSVLCEHRHGENRVRFKWSNGSFHCGEDRIETQMLVWSQSFRREITVKSDVYWDH